MVAVVEKLLTLSGMIFISEHLKMDGEDIAMKVLFVLNVPMFGIFSMTHNANILICGRYSKLGHIAGKKNGTFLRAVVLTCPIVKKDFLA